MKLINRSKYSHVYYNENTDEFLKLFFPTFSKKIKYFLGFRKYPGYNFKFISDELNKLEIQTVKITSCDKYSVTTKNINGVCLEQYINSNLNDPIIDTFVKMVAKILNNGIYYGDFAFDNFIVKNENIYAIDLEDYKKEKILFHSSKEAIRRLYNTLPYSIAKRIEEEFKCSK